MRLHARHTPDRMITLGLILLAVAGVGSYIIQKKLQLPESVADPATGFLYGVAIAVTVLGIRGRARRS
ncbi:MAG: hypothetical protein V4550_17625 [Gemmatimonadota bacterium]